MKNVIKNTKKGIFMVIMFATMLSFANEVSFYSITKNGNETSLTLNNVKAGDLLSILDDKDVVLYKEIIQKNGSYTKGFDLSTLPDGSYAFELNKAVEINTIPFTISNNNVTINKTAEKTIYKPITRVKGSVVLISRFSLEKQPLTVEIYYSADDSVYNNAELIYSEKIKDTENYNRVFRLADINKGSYRIVYNTDGRSFTEEINK